MSVICTFNFKLEHINGSECSTPILIRPPLTMAHLFSVRVGTYSSYRRKRYKDKKAICMMSMRRMMEEEPG